MSKKLPHNMENVCLAADEEAHMYAVGSKANTDLLDARTLQASNALTSVLLTHKSIISPIPP